MKRRGGKCSVVTLEEQKEVLKNYESYFEHDLPSPNDPVFSKIRNELQSKMSEKAIYISLKRNYIYFFGYKKSEENYENEESEHDDDEKNTELGSISDYCSKFTKEETKELSSESLFTFQLDFYKWQRIQPITKYTVRNKFLSTGKYQKKFVLPKHEWAHLLREEVWNKTKIPCSWTFQSHSVKYGEQITCYGTCTECNAQMKLVINWPTDKIAVCEGFILDYNKTFRHNPNKKIKLSPAQRKELSRELKHESPITVRNKLVDSSMNATDSEPPHLPTTGCLKQIKYEQRSSEHYHTNPVMSLWIMTNIEPYDDLIKHLSLYPFYIYYWSSAQDAHYRQYIKDNRVVLSLDATGSLVKEVGPTEKTINPNHIFLYSGVMYDKYNGRSVPIIQMLSAAHDMNLITKWLKTWIDSKSSPNEVVLDQSPALIGAAVKAFTDFESTKEYLTASFNKLEENSETPNETYIRIDVSHLTKILFNLSCFKNVDARVKTFYFRCLLFVRTIEDYVIMKEVVSDIITVTLNRFDADGSRCSISQSRLKKQLLNLKGIHIAEDCQKSKEDDNCTGVVKEKNCITIETSKVPKWFSNQIEKEKLLITLTEDEEMSHENLFYMPSLIPHLTRLVGNLPIWSNLMIPIYHSDVQNPSSSNVESSFKTLKRYVFNIATKSNRLRVDDFVMKHSEFIAGEIKSAISKEKQEIVKVKKDRQKLPKIKTKTKDYFDDSIFAENPAVTENWGGLGNKNLPKTEKSLKYIPLLLNGLNTRSGLKNVVLKNTCAFDAAAQVIASACVDGFAVKTTVFNNTHNTFCMFIKNMLDNKKTKQDLYKNRAQIAEHYFKKSSSRGITEISCECSVTKIFDEIMIDVVYSADVKENCTNGSCVVSNVTRKIAFLPLDTNKKEISEINDSAVAMLESDNIVSCRRNNCAGIRTFTYILHNVINFEFSQSDSVCIDEVPLVLNIQSKMYHIIGIIEYVPSMSNKIDDIGHYRAHCYRQNKWVCYDDLCNRTTRSHRNMIAHCVLYGQK